MFRVAAAEKVVLIAIVFLVSFALSKGAISGGYSFAAHALARERNMEKRSVYEVIIKKNLFDHLAHSFSVTVFVESLFHLFFVRRKHL